MDFVKVLEANDKCEELIKAALPKFHDIRRLQLEHCLDMIKQMRDWPASRLEKSFRWLGYIQGVMHVYDVADLETLKKMNAPTEADTARENETKGKAKTEALKLADQLEIHVNVGSYPEQDEKFFSECVAALRGELPEPPDAEHPFHVLSKELHERLHPMTAHGLRGASTEELVSLTNLAERLEQVKREQRNHREILANMKSVAGVFGSWLKETPQTPVDRTDRAVRADYGAYGLSITLSTGRPILMPWDWYPKLARATDTQRAHFRLIDNGAGIRWPDVNEDLLVSAIVKRAVS